MRALKDLILIGIGGCIYYMIEVVFRGYSHWSMIFVGGLCFFLIGALNNYIEWEVPLYKQMFYGMLIITSTEFVSGIILNIIFKWNVWDYSDLPLNVLGQICLPFCIAWYFLSLVAIVLDDTLRYLLFKEDFPHYHVFNKSK